ncbi:hypothetical protein [Pseudomonas sp. NBRC 111118]|uniref:hypothetical protein n=1 Tax=Pseudomonas sp. NBRC 111118 TaxID=1661033 RepID=UPI0006D42EF9|nr:hypothetical protein [Pseudomonas sp. NBRC 111118]
MNDIKNSFLFILGFVKRLRFVKSDFKELVEFIRSNPAMLGFIKFNCWLMVINIYLVFVCGLVMLWSAISTLLPMSKEVAEYLTLPITLASFYVVAILFGAMKSRVVNAIKMKLTKSRGDE